VNLIFASIGKPKDKNIQDLSDSYITKIKRYLPAEIAELKEPKDIYSQDVAKIIAKEGELLDKFIEKGSYVFVLSEEGKQYSTIDFAKTLSQRMNSGYKKIVFLSGGPFGISADLKKKTNEVISLSKLTFTHELARVLILEQVYRAMTVIRGEKYHY
jgi:23S rRNA (pseudouridine1915-N3)-methyltransferase